mmetsp:Transcript_4523/g.9599  ORF Transcript_4523/g.9599 Transcript_4523/m.9599 type:complete len:468 (-) Transcript_4523:70-1473(-)
MESSCNSEQHQPAASDQQKNEAPAAEPVAPAPTDAAETNLSPSTTTAKPRRRRIIRKKRSAGGGVLKPDVPDSISQNPALLSAISSSLPKDYEFEIPKTVHRINQAKARHVALQLPEGLLMYACSLGDILKAFTEPGCCERISILGDVTYGACCVDDLSAEALGCDLLVHYGHSCLVPITETVVKCLYVFVEIRIDVQHLVDCFCATCEEGTQVFVMGTVQFRAAVVEAAKILNTRNRPATVPQAKPLSPGEVLGCTAPSDLCKCSISGKGDGENVECGDSKPEGEKVMLFVADGRFHLEAAMISNPTLRALRYDPYNKVLTDEKYETDKMKAIRNKSIQRAMDPNARTFGIILGTLGRQGNPAILGQIRKLLHKHNKKSFVILLSEIFPQKLDMFPAVDVWVQIACPRLSVDWGHHFTKPMLNPYELNVALGEVEFREAYPMDFYRKGSGRWTNYHEENRTRKLLN